MCDKDLKKCEVYYLDILNGAEPKKAESDLHRYSCPEIGLAELKAPKHISNDKKKRFLNGSHIMKYHLL